MKKCGNSLYLALCCALLAIPILLWGGESARFIRFHISRLWSGTDLHLDALTTSTPLSRVPVRIADISAGEAMDFDPRMGERGMVSYQLSGPTWVRVRVVRREQADLLLRTLVNWEAREEGIHHESWDGKDASGNVVDPSGCCFLLATGEGIHSQHDWRQCGDLEVEIVRPAVAREEVRGTCLVEISVTRGGAVLQEGREYAVRLYVDYQHARTHRCTSQLADSFVFAWNSQDQIDGEHTVTVVVDDGEDHLGTASRRVLVRNTALPASLHSSTLGALIRNAEK